MGGEEGFETVGAPGLSGNFLTGGDGSVATADGFTGEVVGGNEGLVEDERADSTALSAMKQAIDMGFESAPDPTAPSGALSVPSSFSAPIASISAPLHTPAIPPPAAVAAGGVVLTAGNGPLAAAAADYSLGHIQVMQTVHEFYLARIPRPNLSSSHSDKRMAELKLKEKREKHQAISAALRVKQAERSEAYERQRVARERARACSQEVQSRFEEVRPLQEEMRRLQEVQSSARARGRELPCTSESELNQIIAEIEQRMSHESMPLTEEKRLLRQLQQLQHSREDVRAAEALLSSVTDLDGQKEAIQGRLKPLMAEVEVLKLEREVAQKICRAHEEEARAVEEEVKKLMADRFAAMKEQDEAYEQLKALRDDTYLKENDFRQFQRDLAKAQELAAAKDLAALGSFCKEQVERVHAKLNENPEFCTAYFNDNEGSTLRRFRSLDTRRPGLNESPSELMGTAAAANEKVPPVAGTAAAKKMTGAAEEVKQLSAESRKGEGDEAAEGREKGFGKNAGEIAKAKPSKKADEKGAGGKEGKEKAGKERKLTANEELPYGNGEAAEADDVAERIVESKEEGVVEVVIEEKAGQEERERIRQEAMRKAKEAEERRKRAAERSLARQQAKEKKEAEEAAKRREKEKERRARKKAAAAAATGASGGEGGDSAEDEGDSGAADDSDAAAESSATETSGAISGPVAKSKAAKAEKAKKSAPQKSKSSLAKALKGSRTGTDKWMYIAAAVVAAIAILVLLILAYYQSPAASGTRSSSSTA